VVHDYGDICQAVTELALEQHAPITTAEFHTLNRCLDTAIAEAVTEHGRVSAERASLDELERSGEAAHEIRNMVNTASMAFQMLKTRLGRGQRQHRSGAGPEPHGPVRFR
jgi:transketolase C-terminal domain/subunit